MNNAAALVVESIAEDNGQSEEPEVTIFCQGGTGHIRNDFHDNVLEDEASKFQTTYMAEGARFLWQS